MSHSTFVCGQCVGTKFSTNVENEMISHLCYQHLNYFPIACGRCVDLGRNCLVTNEQQLTLHYRRKHPNESMQIKQIRDEEQETKLKSFMAESRSHLTAVNTTLLPPNPPLCSERTVVKTTLLSNTPGVRDNIHNSREACPSEEQSSSSSIPSKSPVKKPIKPTPTKSPQKKRKSIELLKGQKFLESYFTKTKEPSPTCQTKQKTNDIVSEPKNASVSSVIEFESLFTESATSDADRAVDVTNNLTLTDKSADTRTSTEACSSGYVSPQEDARNHKGPERISKRLRIIVKPIGSEFCLFAKCNKCESVVGIRKGAGTRNHLYSHTTSPAFPCPFCHKTFRYSCDLRRHEATRHPNEVMPVGGWDKFDAAEIKELFLECYGCDVQCGLCEKSVKLSALENHLIKQHKLDKEKSWVDVAIKCYGSAAIIEEYKEEKRGKSSMSATSAQLVNEIDQVDRIETSNDDHAVNDNEPNDIEMTENLDDSVDSVFVPIPVKICTKCPGQLPVAEPERHVFKEHLNLDKKPFTCHCDFTAVCLSDVTNHIVRKHTNGNHSIFADLKCLDEIQKKCYECFGS